MQVRSNRVKETLKAGGTVFSSSLRLPEPGLCEILGYAGFDLVLLDGEHGACDAGTLDRLIQSCFAANTVPIHRVLRNDDGPAIMHALDLGVQGILLPHCRTEADARRLKSAALYTPAGNRGVGPGRGQLWGRVPFPDYLAAVNDTILLLGLIEDVVGVDNIESIAAAGLDVLWVGTGDLSADMGFIGQTSHPRVLDAALHILKTSRKHGVACAFPARDAESAAWAIEQGFQVIGYGGAEQYIMQTSRQFLQSFGR